MKRFCLPVCLLLIAGCASTNEKTQSPATLRLSTGEKEKESDAYAHYLSSVIYQRTGRPADAVKELRKAADLSPGSLQLQVSLLGAYYLNEDYDNAATMVERALDEEPESVVLHIWRGRIYYQLERFDDATRSFRQAIELDPDNALAYEALAEIEEETNDLVGAIDVYNQMIEITPDSAFLHYRLGLNLLELNDAEGAMASLEKALELNEELDPAHYMIGALHLDAGRHEEAIRHFQAFLRSDPEHVRTIENIAGAYYGLGQDGQAIDILTGLIEGPNVSTEHHLLRTFILLQQDAPAKAGLVAAPNGAPLLGTVLQALARKKGGEPYMPILSRLDDVDGDLDFECNVYLNRIVSLFAVEKGGTYLVDELRALVDEGVRSRVLSTILGRALMSMDRDEESVEVLLDVLKRYGGDKWLHYYIATTSDNLDASDRTEKHLRACLEFDPNDPDVLNFLGYFLADENRKLDEAEALLERALQIDPENGFYLDSLGWIYYRNGKGELAVEYIRRAIRAMTSDDAVLRDHLGDAYLLNKQRGKAVVEWRRALRLDPAIEGVQKKLDRYEPGLTE